MDTWNQGAGVVGGAHAVVRKGVRGTGGWRDGGNGPADAPECGRFPVRPS